MNEPATPGRIRTGLFEIELASGELFREGRKIPLQEQPFRVLSLLLEHPGALVTRETLQADLWPSDTYVGFDEGLNVAIRKLRVAFGDSAENPRFIETVPRRGYRFIAPVLAPASAPEQLDIRMASQHEAGVAAAKVSPEQSARIQWLRWAASTVVVAIVLAAIAYVVRVRRPAITSHTGCSWWYCLSRTLAVIRVRSISVTV